MSEFTFLFRGNDLDALSAGRVESGGIADDAALSHWVGLARAFVDPLPPKAAKKKK